MKRTGTKETKDSLNMSRRDVLKMMGAGALFAMLPGYGLGGSASGFSPSGGRGLIFLVGDGMPLGVIKGMHQIRTRLYGDKDTNFYSRMKDIHSAVGYSSTDSLSSIVTDSAPASVAWSTGSIRPSTRRSLPCPMVGLSGPSWNFSKSRAMPVAWSPPRG
jgi:alkaline phosphatase